MYFTKLYKVCMVLFVTSAVLQGCKKYETEPLERITEDIVYDQMDINGFYADRALTNLYTYLPDGFNRINNAYLDAATDDAVTSQYTSNIQILSQGLQSPTNTVDDTYANNYAGIFRANLFLSKIGQVPITAENQQYSKAEARFLRAMFYFELIKRYGGVPLLGDRVFALNDNINLPKNTFDECVNYIVSECDAISGLLRGDAAVITTLLGHAPKGAALALKARTLLYAASPLNNPSGAAAKWQAAADAAKALIDLNYYALNASFGGTFTTRTNKEIILAIQRNRGQSLELANSPVGYTTDLFTSRGGTSPTQELVDAFVTINGKPISTDLKTPVNTTGYDPANPYANRDPRFAATIFYNGQQWLSRAVETFDGGLDRPGGSLVQTKTGYYLRKFLPDLSTATNYSAADHNFPTFRYAEVLLNYAEAANEVGGAANLQIAYNQLIAIRKRAGIVAGNGALYGLEANMDQAAMRNAIKLERRLELAFEEHRFWDERRWKTAEVNFNKSLHGIRITKDASGNFSYQTVEAANIRFKSPMYRYPFAYGETIKNTALIQNPGW